MRVKRSSLLHKANTSEYNDETSVVLIVSENQCTLQLQIYQKSGKGCVVVVYGTPATVNIIIL